MNLHILQFVDDCLDCAYLVLVTTYVYFCFGHAILSTLLLILCANSDTINSTISAPCQLHLTASYRLAMLVESSHLFLLEVSEA